MAVLDRIFPSSGRTTSSCLSFANLAGLLLLVLLGYVSVYTYTTWRRLRHVPGPRSAGLTKWWMLRNTLGGSMHLALKAACETHGKALGFRTPSPKLPGLFSSAPDKTYKTCRPCP